MKFATRFIPLIIAFGASQCAFSQDSNAATPAPPKASGVIVEEVAAIVGNAPIMLSEIERVADMVVERRKKDGLNNTLSAQEEAFETLLLQRLLAQRGKADSIDKDMNRTQIATNVESQVAQLIEAAGSVKALEKAYGKAIFLIKKDLSEQALEQQIAQEMQSKVKREVKVSSADVNKFFATLTSDSLPPMPPQYIYAQIVKSPPQTEERKYKIREQLLDFRKRILSGEAKLSVLARMYSLDPGSAKNGGEYTPQPIQEVVGPFAEALDGLKPGQISEVVETEFGYHIIELISRKGDIVHYRHILLKPEFTVEEIQNVTHELDSVANEIRSGNITFAQAALKYSDDAESRENGGVVYNIQEYYKWGRDLSKATTRFIADEIAVSDFRNLVNLQPGEISKSFEAQDPLKGNIVYKIVTLKEIIPTHQAAIDQDYDLISQIATIDKQERSLDEWVKKAISEMYIYITPQYRNNQFQYPQWVETCVAQETETINEKLPKSVLNTLNGAAVNPDNFTDAQATVAENTQTASNINDDPQTLTKEETITAKPTQNDKPTKEKKSRAKNNQKNN